MAWPKRPDQCGCCFDGRYLRSFGCRSGGAGRRDLPAVSAAAAKLGGVAARQAVRDGRVLLHHARRLGPVRRARRRRQGRQPQQ